nr:hypothetical protein [Corynebacterium sp. CNCTC7651]
MAHPSRTLTAVAALALAATLAACGDTGTTPTATPEAPSDTATTTTATTSAPETTTEAEETTTPPSETTSTKRTSSSKSSPTSEASEAQMVEEVAQRFATLAPPELFAQLESCTASGLEGSFDCSGPGVGQFQFFDSESKAASTTQLLTELRSSRVVEDKGDRVVGWSVLGTSAIITVVDNEAGQVMQQLISTDQEDPRKRIFELGLAEQVDVVSTPGAPGREARDAESARTTEPKPGDSAN